ncbi:beta-1,3-galactosyltransferase 5-like [Styela clava]
MQVRNKCITFVKSLKWYRDGNKRRSIILMCIFIIACVMFKLAFVVLHLHSNGTNGRKLMKLQYEHPRLVAHHKKYNEIDGFIKNGTTQRKHIKILVSPWNVNISSSRAGLFKDKINVESWSSITVVKSSLLNKKRRNVIRETWGKFKFIDGVRLETVFILGTTNNIHLQSDIKEENQIYGDILQVDLPDTKENVPLKLLAGMRWASTYLPQNWLYSSADDDFAIHLPNFLRYIETMRRRIPSHPLPIMCIYGYRQAEEPDRQPESPWFVSLEQYPAKYWPPYCRGGWYTMPIATTSKLYEVSRTTPFLYLDDVWVTGIMRVMVNNQEGKSIPPGSLLSEEGITYAPLANRTNHELYWNKFEDDLNKVIVTHTWSGNYGWLRHNIDDDIRNIWSKWENSFMERMKYFVTFGSSD